MSLLVRLLAHVPLRFMHVLGALLGWLAFLASPTYRRRFLANAARAGYGFAQVRAAVAQAGRTVAEIPRLWFGTMPVCMLNNERLVAQAYAAGRGVIYLTPHLGCFELSAQDAARRWGGVHGPITVLYRPARQAWLARMMETARNRPAMQAVPTSLAGVRQMIKALRRGEAVGLLPDQVPPHGLGVWAPFFGHDAYTMTLAARLAQQTGAQVLVVYCERLPHGRGYVTHFERLEAPLSDDAVLAATQINRAMEGLIRQCPQQYLWGYARYKRPRGQAPAHAPVVEGAA
jgi:KDO2-lipid IV(A) lauroyltransferase